VRLPRESIRRDGGTQVRERLSDRHVREYAEQLDAMPPVVVFHDGVDHWLADGFHRVAAAELAGRGDVLAEVHDGGQRDALIFAVGANATHGIRRTNVDKRHAVEVLLHDEEWSQWSDRAIADACGVSDPFVGKTRKRLAQLQLRIVSSCETTKGRDGRRRKRSPKPVTHYRCHRCKAKVENGKTCEACFDENEEAQLAASYISRTVERWPSSRPKAVLIAALRAKLAELEGVGP
jgi:hypothetical protein